MNHREHRVINQRSCLGVASAMESDRHNKSSTTWLGSLPSVAACAFTASIKAWESRTVHCLMSTRGWVAGACAGAGGVRVPARVPPQLSPALGPDVLP